MNTHNIREKIFQDEVGKQIEGVTGRWTFFSQLHKPEQPDNKLAVNVFAIDSKAEIKIGVGRLFESKKVIGERQAVVS